MDNSDFFYGVKSSEDLYIALENYYSCGGRLYGTDIENETNGNQEQLDDY